MNTRAYKIGKWILDYLPEYIALVALTLAIPISAANALSRYALKYTFPWYPEMIRVAFAWIVFPGAAAAYWRHMHFGIDLIVNLMPKSIQRLMGIFSHVFMTALLAVLTYLSIVLTAEVGVKYFPVTFLSYAYYDSAMIVGFGFMMIYSAIFTVQEIKNVFGKKTAVDTQEGGNEA